MSIIECRLAAEKRRGNKPFTVCEVSTWYWLDMYWIEEKHGVEYLRKTLKRLYESFGNGKDKTERGATLQELKKLTSNGGLRIISKDYQLIDVDKWEA